MRCFPLRVSRVSLSPSPSQCRAERSHLLWVAIAVTVTKGLLFQIGNETQWVKQHTTESYAPMSVNLSEKVFCDITKKREIVEDYRVNDKLRIVAKFINDYYALSTGCSFHLFIHFFKNFFQHKWASSNRREEKEERRGLREENMAAAFYTAVSCIKCHKKSRDDFEIQEDVCRPYANAMPFL